MDQPVDHGGGHLLVVEDVDPTAELQVGGDHHAAALVAVGNHLE